MSVSKWDLVKKLTVALISLLKLTIDDHAKRDGQQTFKLYLKSAMFGFVF